MHILVTNDDGVEAPGLLALATALRPLGKITVLAPDHNWSASGHVKTMHRPLRVNPTTLADGTPALASDGAPSDCVALALLGLVPESIDLVVSGINPNANVGYDVTYSGTVTAAMEATIAGVPGLAVSLDTPEIYKPSINYEPAANVAALIVSFLLQHPTPKGVLLNVNIPYGSLDSLRGIAVTRQGLRVYRDALVERTDPRGRPYYWIGGEAPTGIPDEGTDFWALSERMVSVTPLQLDLTARDHLSLLKSWDLHL